MPSYTHNSNRNLQIPREHVAGPSDKTNPSPITPAVTGILYPTSSMYSATEAESSRYETAPTRLYNHPNVGGSAIGDGTTTESGAFDDAHLDQIWGTIRQQKERKMAKERPKVQSLEEPTNDPSIDHHPIDIPLMDAYPASPPRSLKKRKSISSFRESTDGRSIVATFDLPDVAKEDIHVSFQKNRLVVTWATAELAEWEENGIVMRERLERMYHRILPMPEGTKFEEVRCSMTSRQLTLRYPNMRCYRVESNSRSGDS